MLGAFGTLLPYAVPVALSPLPTIAVVLLLLGPTGSPGGIGLLAGRLVALAGMTWLVAILLDRFADPARSLEINGWLRIGLGCVMLAGAAIFWHRRPGQDEAPKLPRWIQSLESATPIGAVRVGFLLTIANVKEVAFVVGAGVLLGTMALGTGQILFLATMFAAMASLGVAIPVIWVVLSPQQSLGPLSALRGWLVRNNSIVIAAVFLVIGAMLIGKGLEAL